MPMWISDRRIYTTADGSRAVEEGDPDGALLLVGEGCQIPEETARKYGLIKDLEQQPEGGPSYDGKSEGGQGEGSEDNSNGDSDGESENGGEEKPPADASKPKAPKAPRAKDKELK